MKKVKYHEDCTQGNVLRIENNCKCSEHFGVFICKHCHSIDIELRARPNGMKFYETIWTCPRVVIAKYENGKISICIDCILEAIKNE